MALFQNSVLNKYLQNQKHSDIEAAYRKFADYFQNAERQENIRAAKEEQFQEGFLRALFVDVLGYTLNPEPGYNLTTEFKNLVGSKKADGAVLMEGKALAVIELKGTDTTDLDKINSQAFSYKNNHPGCNYIITSNFEKLRFFIQNAVEFLEFNLFNLSLEDFKVLWLCLQTENLLSNIPLKAKEESLLIEEGITKKLYRDYADFKNELWQNLVVNHQEYNELELFKKTQKLIDRFLFIFFAEDSGLLPPNSISRMIERYHMLKDEDAYKPLYEIFKQYFGYINSGRKGKTAQDDIFAYNGGLFAHDDLLDTMRIDDAALLPHITKLTAYDFESEVDVNILGHIFENSLNEIESISARLEGSEMDSSKTKRKKDGVFYTPKYITKYIVENTVGKLCEAKRTELGIVDEDFARGRRNRNKTTIKQLDGQLQAYRKWLLDITIVDPACGSGAFLNQALDFLIQEHSYIDELESQLLGYAFEFPGVESHILERNLFGVDINEEAIDIARLSLWLRTAQRGRKLTTLSHNIKCGNSLIDDPKVAGPKAFSWKKEFPQVFEKGGFDVVIGNPPYVRQELITPFKPYFEKRFKTFAGTADLYTYFIEMGVDELLKGDGLYSIIVSNKWMRARFGQALRGWMKQKEIVEIIDFGDLPVFADATAYPCILTLRGAGQSEQSAFRACIPTDLHFGDLQLLVADTSFEVEKAGLAEDGWALVNNRVSKLIEKIKHNGTPLSKFVDGKIFYGIKTGFNEAFVIDRATRDRLIALDPKSAEIIKPFLAGRDVKRYFLDFQERYLIFTRRGIDIEVYPAIKAHLEQFRPQLEPKPKDHTGFWPGRKPGPYKWYEIQDSIDYYAEFEKPKIEVASITIKPAFSRSFHGHYSNDKTNIIGTDNAALLAILNSELSFFFIKSIAATKSGGFFEYKPMYIGQIPIPEISNEVEISRKVEEIEKLISERNTIKGSFSNLLLQKFDFEVLSQNLQNWPSLDFKGFLTELKKAKVKLSLAEEAEWLAYFTTQKEKANTLQAEITRLDKEIDQMVYQLYGLSEEEVRIVEDSK